MKNDKIIVLEIGGKRDEIDTVKVILFDSMEEASEYREDNTNRDGKYWTLCKIIDNGFNYFVSRYDIQMLTKI